MHVTLVGSRFFGAEVLKALAAEPGITIAAVVAPAADDRLALAAQAAGLPVHVLANPKRVPAEAVPKGTGLVVAAHTHARVSNEALARARLGGVGYHPSLLPRHRGIAAVEWTILEGDPIAGGSVYHLADGWDAGAIAAQDWCFVGKGETARSLWERALAPMGLALLAQVVRHARDHGALPARVQDTAYATKAPLLRRAVVLTDDQAPASAALVVTVMGADRPGIVNALAERGERHGANWCASRMSRLAGEFAGMVHFEVPPERADALAQALQDLQTQGLKVVISRSADGTPAGALRPMALELVGEDRAGIVARLTRALAGRGISIESLHTELLRTGVQGRQTFKVGAQLLVPPSVDTEALRAELGTLAQALMLDIALG
jgi:glycine cleavage system regulatory protein/folate-dependent phosphoribosylglycinamide formyltransferase PurN